MKKNYKTKTIEFGQLKPGDKIIGSQGEPVIVNRVYDKHIPERMYEIEMENGEIIRASGNHLWYCESKKDIKTREEYLELAKDYFTSNDIPENNVHNPHYPLAVITTKFGEDIRTRIFIERACRSLGYSLSTPHVVLEDDDSTEEQLYRYSFNDLIVFLSKMKESVINGNGYFYFGEVRTTDEIFKLKRYNIDVNIPSEGEVK